MGQCVFSPYFFRRWAEEAAERCSRIQR
jgi:hypothetical protein